MQQGNHCRANGKVYLGAFLQRYYRADRQNPPWECCPGDCYLGVAVFDALAGRGQDMSIGSRFGFEVWIAVLQPRKESSPCIFLKGRPVNMHAWLIPVRSAGAGTEGYAISALIAGASEVDNLRGLGNVEGGRILCDKAALLPYERGKVDAKWLERIRLVGAVRAYGNAQTTERIAVETSVGFSDCRELVEWGDDFIEVSSCIGDVG